MDRMNCSAADNIDKNQKIPTIKDILKARDLLRNETVRKTPLHRSDTFSKFTGNNVFLKIESLQRTGSFKVRGAFVKLSMLSDEQRKYGVIAASAGNHAQGLAYAAFTKKFPALL